MVDRVGKPNMVGRTNKEVDLYSSGSSGDRQYPPSDHRPKIVIFAEDVCSRSRSIIVDSDRYIQTSDSRSLRDLDLETSSKMSKINLHEVKYSPCNWDNISDEIDDDSIFPYQSKSLTDIFDPDVQIPSAGKSESPNSADKQKIKEAVQQPPEKVNSLRSLQVHSLQKATLQIALKKEEQQLEDMEDLTVRFRDTDGDKNTFQWTPGKGIEWFVNEELQATEVDLEVSTTRGTCFVVGMDVVTKLHKNWKTAPSKRKRKIFAELRKLKDFYYENVEFVVTTGDGASMKLFDCCI